MERFWFSKHLGFLNSIPCSNDMLLKSKKKFSWKNGIPKVKHSTLVEDYQDEGLKNADILSKFSTSKVT